MIKVELKQEIVYLFKNNPLNVIFISMCYTHGGLNTCYEINFNH